MAPARSSPRWALVKNSHSTARRGGWVSSGSKRLAAPKLRTLPATMRSIVSTERVSPSSSSGWTRCRASRASAPDSGWITAWT